MLYFSNIYSVGLYFIIIFSTVYACNSISILPLCLLCTSIARNWRPQLLLEGDICCMREPLDELKTSRRYLHDWCLKNLAVLSPITSAACPGDPFEVIGSAVQIITFVSQTGYSELSLSFSLSQTRAVKSARPTRTALAKVTYRRIICCRKTFADSRAEA